jgi:hypothetical protein
VLIILQIWDRGVISPKQGVASLVSPKEEGVSVIYPFNFFKYLIKIKILSIDNIIASINFPHNLELGKHKKRGTSLVEGSKIIQQNNQQIFLWTCHMLLI